MFQPTLMTGQRILVTGGGTGLGQAMRSRTLASLTLAAPW